MSASWQLEAEADNAVRRGDLPQAANLLSQAAAAEPQFALLLKLASVQRALQSTDQAIATIERALALQPLDFIALVMRATLLEAAQDSGAGEAWSNALAQKPANIPPQLTAAVARGEAKAAEWLATRERALAEATLDVEQGAGEDEKWRIRRFRDNVVRRTRVYHSTPTHYFYPGLTEREFHPRHHFDWLAELEALTPVIKAELAVLMKAERRRLVPYVQYAAHEPLDQWKELNHNPDWTAIHLWKNGEQIAVNAAHCPRTMAFLSSLNQPQVPTASPNAMFSLLAPNTRIPAHVGVSNTRLICHLPLIVPPGCWFRVGAETRDWVEGEAFIFDDTIEHEAMNPTDQLRVVLIFDLWHPDLSAAEREAVARLTAADCRSPPDMK